MQGFFERLLPLARELGAPRVGRMAIDGSKIQANASKHKATSYERMRDKGRQLRDEVKELLAHAEAVDATEDAEYGADHGDELPAELQRRESRLQRIREAKRALEARAKAEASGRITKADTMRSAGASRAAIQKRRPRLWARKGANLAQGEAVAAISVGRASRRPAPQAYLA